MSDLQSVYAAVSATQTMQASDVSINESTEYALISMIHMCIACTFTLTSAICVPVPTHGLVPSMTSQQSCQLAV